MDSSVFILFDAYRPTGGREVYAVFASREAAEDERTRLLANGGRWEIEEHAVRD